ncbi:MAG: acyl-homoserine-lactone synthase [Pseudomonadota bacterium]
MILHVETHEREKYAKQLRSYFRLRKKVFVDQLRWVETTDGDIEFDELDVFPCTYTLYVDKNDEVLAGARLIPTTQMTLLERWFPELLPEDMSFKSPTIWESSRYCIDGVRSGKKLSSGAKRANLAINIGNLDYALRVGITEFITVVEYRLFAMSNTFGMGGQILSEWEYDGMRVVCVMISITEENKALADKMRVFL